jgi:glycosyltransferase involved in cell wall biosynthesis
MRIFCAIEEEPIPGNRLWHNNIVGALRDVGHEVLLFDYPTLDAFYRHANTAIPTNRSWIEQRRPELESELWRQIAAANAKAPLDIFLSYFYSAHARPETIRRIRDLGVRTVNWYCNASYQFDQVKEIAPAYDLCLVPEKDRLNDYRAVGAHPLYCQEAANPVFYRDLKRERDLGVVFIGQRYATREELCYAVHHAGFPIDVWGAGWGGPGAESVWRQGMRRLWRFLQKQRGQAILPARRCHGFINDEKMIEVYNRAKIVLGFGVVSAQDFREKPRYQIRLRDFEAPMCGAFYLMEHQEEIREFFRIGEEIETFRDRAELLDKIRYYLAHDDARNRIRLAGYERARRDHTWQKRLTDVFQFLLPPNLPAGRQGSGEGKDEGKR